MTDDLTPPLLDRYLAGELTPTESHTLDRWAAEEPARRETLQALRETFVRRSDVEATQVRAQLDAKLSEQGLGIRRPRRRDVWREWNTSRITAFAVLIIVVGIGLGVIMRPWGGASSATSARTYTTNAGQRAVVTLADGSRMLLGPATTVSVTVRDRAGTMATVTGQAMFTVATRHDKPFVVTAGRAITHVLGTTFMVRHYEHERTTRVAVTEGRVSLADARVLQATRTSAIVLNAHAAGIVDDSGHVRTAPSTAIDDYTAWTTGQLVFHQTPVADIVTELGRAYGVTIQLTDTTLSQRAFTWSVSVTNISLGDALDALTTALNAHVTRSNGVLTIVPGAAVSRDSKHFPHSNTSETQYGR